MNANIFDREYKNYVIKWIQIRNYEQQKEFGDIAFFIEPDDFYIELSAYIFVERSSGLPNRIEYYNEKKGSFKTWISRIMNNLWSDKARVHSRRIQYSSLDKMHNEIGFDISIEDDKLQLEEQSALVNSILEKINQIDKVQDRVLLKLKFYIKDLFRFSDEELAYIQIHIKKKSGHITPEHTISYINSRAKISGGLKNKTIAELTEFAEKGISTISKRLVRKLNIMPYI